MKSKILVALCFAAMSFSAIAFELKGLKTGMNISFAEERFPLMQMKPSTLGIAPETWLTKSLPDGYKTLADQPISFISFSGEPDGTVREIKFVFSCVGYERIVKASLESKFGKAKFDPKRESFVWANKSGELIFRWYEQIKGTNVCGALVMRDPELVKWHIEQAKTKPAPVSKDL